MKLLAAVSALLAGSCTSPSPLPASTTEAFDPISFFSGRTAGEGTIHKLFSSPVSLTVESMASRQTADTLVLSQTIREGASQPRTREWSIRRVRPGRFEGKLTPDAVGPVTMTVRGPRASIRYRMKGGLDVHQQLALQSRTDIVCNRLEVRKLGVRVAWVGETIQRMRKSEPKPAPVACPGA